MKRLSFRLQIAFFSAAISGAVLLGFGSASWYLISRQRIEAVDREIRTLSARHPGWFANRGSYDRLTGALEFTFGESRKEHVLLLIRTPAGRMLYRSPHWPPDLKLERLGLTFGDEGQSVAPVRAADAIDQGRAGESGPAARGRDREAAPEAPSPLSSPAASVVQGGSSERALSKDQESAPPPVGRTNLESAPRMGPPWGMGMGPGRGGRGRGFGMGWGGSTPAPFTRPPRFATVQTAKSAWRFGVLGNDEIVLCLGLNFDEVQGELGQMRKVFLLALPLALLVVGFGGWAVAGRALRPLQAIADTAERVTARGLDQRIPLSDVDPEISRVIQVLNRMMDRLEASFHQATRFSADASHELKTPLTIMQGELESALQSVAPGSKEQQVFSNLLDETQRLKTITRRLLLLAQADAGQLKLALEPVNLSAAMEQLVEDARILASETGLTFDVRVPPQLTVEADRALLEMALFNLLNNAVKYNQPGGRVSVHLEARAKQIVLTIGNTGPGIPAGEQPRIFERFHRAHRGDESRAEGFGLGLSLARKIIRAHGGELALQESRPGWTCFALTLS